jgi:diacylglycerol kinase family enzyme
MFAIIFHNPTSGTKGIDKKSLLAAAKLANIDAEYVSVKSDNFEKAFDQKADLFIAAGGDGTIQKQCREIAWHFRYSAGVDGNLGSGARDTI